MSDTYPTNAPDEIVVVDVNDQLELIVPDGYPAAIEVEAFGSTGETIELEVLQPMPGPPGTHGDNAAAGYLHTQSSESAVWTVPHNLGHRPIVSITTIGGVEVLGGEIVHLSNNTLTITFDVPFAGYARLI